jgi:hypothetical protein
MAPAFAAIHARSSKAKRSENSAARRASYIYDRKPSLLPFSPQHRQRLIRKRMSKTSEN